MQKNRVHGAVGKAKLAFIFAPARIRRAHALLMYHARIRRAHSRVLEPFIPNS